MFQWAKLHNWSPVHRFSHLNIDDSDLVVLSRKHFDGASQGPFSSRSFCRHYNHHIANFQIRLISASLLSCAQTRNPLTQPPMPKVANKFLEPTPPLSWVDVFSVNTVLCRSSSYLPMKEMVWGERNKVRWVG